MLTCKQVLVEGYQRSILTSVRPYHLALYSSWRTNSPHPTSLMAFANAVVLDHVLDGQTLHADHLVFVDDACTELVLVVSSPVIDTRMDLGHLLRAFFGSCRPFFFLACRSLGFCQSLLIFGIIAWVANQLSQSRGPPST